MEQYSEVWRVNRSKVQELELAASQTTLNKIVNMLGLSNCTLHWAKDSETTGCRGIQYDGLTPLSHEISLGLEHIPTDVPFDSDSFDVITGITAHEAAHALCGSTEIITLDGLAATLAQLGEEWCADRYWHGTGTNKYLRKARQKCVETLGKEQENGELIYDLLLAYLKMIIYQIPHTITNPQTQELFQELCRRWTGIEGKKPGTRLKLYKETAQWLEEEYQKSGKRKAAAQRLREGGSRATQGRVDREIAEELQSDTDQAKADLQKYLDNFGESEHRKLSAELASAVQNSVNSDRTDITERIGELAGHPGTANVILENLLSEKLTELDEETSKSVKFLLRRKTNKDVVPVKGLPRGKVDCRRLYRTAMSNPNVFRRFKHTNDNPEEIWLLMDGSGSMDCSHKKRLYNVGASFHQIAKGRVYIYDGKVEGSVIRRADVKSRVRWYEPDGGTPSGEAILAVADLLQKNGGGLLIHFTDGQAGGGWRVEHCLKAVLEKCPDVKLLNIVLGNSQLLTDGVDVCDPEHRVMHNIRIREPRRFGEVLFAELKKYWKV